MLSILRNRFGMPGVIAVIALVFAMFGGAYAASSSGGGKATASAKAKRGPRGPRGPAGPTGPVGSAGPAGAQGPAGAKGEAGAKGATGEAGAKGATGAAGSTGATGAAGSTGATGAAGATGATGLSGFTETLPSGKTETGTWTMGPTPNAGPGELHVPISFAIPLAAELDEANVHYINDAGKEVPKTGPTVTSTVCLGTAAAPKAAAGHLCIYTKNSLFITTLHNGSIFKSGANGVGASTAGSMLSAVFSGEEAEAVGTWAVTAP
ncbi:MAG: hypothetical protein QOF13_1713 [Solirubrobacterales bacterium]|jgi:hypothetical protein|nr:hypothetical protein [Solirubrobacterales bacterium]